MDLERMKVSKVNKLWWNLKSEDKLPEEIPLNITSRTVTFLPNHQFNNVSSPHFSKRHHKRSIILRTGDYGG